MQSQYIAIRNISYYYDPNVGPGADLDGLKIGNAGDEDGAIKEIQKALAFGSVTKGYGQNYYFYQLNLEN